MAGLTFEDLGACNCATCSVTITVKGCDGVVDTVDTLTISVYDSTDTTLIATGTTSTGVLSLAIPSTGTYHVHVTGQNARFANYNASRTLTCGSPATVSLSPASGYTCPTNTLGCFLPIKTTLTCTLTVGGTCTLTWGGVFWTGTITIAGNVWDVSTGGGAISVFETVAPNTNCDGTATSLTCPPGYSLSGTFPAGVCTTTLGTWTLTE